MGGWESRPRRKSLRREFVKVGEIEIKLILIQIVSFRRISVTMRKKYIPTTDYVTITPSQKVQEKYF